MAAYTIIIAYHKFIEPYSQVSYEQNYTYRWTNTGLLSYYDFKMSPKQLFGLFVNNADVFFVKLTVDLSMTKI